MSSMYVVVEDAGYDVGRIIRGVFSTAQKADDWVAAKAAERANEVLRGNVTRWGAPSYDIEQHQLDPDIGDLYIAP